MPSIRIGLSTQFNLENEQVGIGTTNPTATLEVIGNIVAEGAAGGSGVSTFREYQGFHQSEQGIANNIVIDNQTGGPFSSLSADLVISGETTISSGSTVEIGKTKTLTVTDKFAVPLGDTNSRDNTPEAGTTRFNQDFGTLEFFDGNNWKTVNSYARGGAAGRGLFAGGQTPTILSIIDFINISTLGNATNFGTLSVSRSQLASCSSSTRGLFAGGYNPTFQNVIDYITIASEGNAIDFGDLHAAKRRMSGGGCSSSTRGLFAGGFTSTPASTSFNNIDYVTIATIGNALDFGDLSAAKGFMASISSSTRGIFGGGFPVVKTIEFVTISSTGNATNFGDLLNTSYAKSGVSNGTRGVFAGGNTQPTALNVIEFITIATTGNATYFGDLTVTNYYNAACSSSTRGVFGGGDAPTITTIIDFITINTSGNAQDFGDLTVARDALDACSDSHGGLGGF